MKKEYSEIYRARLKELKPLVKSAAVKKWGKKKGEINYNQTLLSAKPGVNVI